MELTETFKQGTRHDNGQYCITQLLNDNSHLVKCLEDDFSLLFKDLGGHPALGDLFFHLD